MNMNKINNKIILNLSILAMLVLGTTIIPTGANAQNGFVQYTDGYVYYNGYNGQNNNQNYYNERPTPIRDYDYYDYYSRSNYYNNYPPAPVYVNPTPTPVVVYSSTANPTTRTNTTNKTVVTKAKTTAPVTATTTTTTNDSAENSQLAANALFGSNSFIPSGITQWIFFAILVVLAAILVRRIYGGSEKYNAIPLKHK